MPKIEQVIDKPEPTDWKVEMESLTAIMSALKSVDKDSQTRILNYAKDRLGIYLGS